MRTLKSIPNGLLFLLVLSSVPCQVQANPCAYEVKHVTIRCANITTSDDALRAKQYLANDTNSTVLGLFNSNVDLLPDDFLAGSSMTEVHFVNCTMTELPYRLTNAVFHSLRLLEVGASTILRAHTPGGGFLHYPKLELLAIHTSSVRIPSRAFVDLFNLKMLYLVSNTELLLEDKDFFQGLTKLQELNMSSNNLKVLPEGLFDPVRDSLKQLNLSGNPFRCNCAMQWLQDWLKEMEQKKLDFRPGVSCKTPIKGDLMKLKFCTKATAITEGHCTGAPLLEKLHEQALVTLRKDCPNLTRP